MSRLLDLGAPSTPVCSYDVFQTQGDAVLCWQAPDSKAGRRQPQNRVFDNVDS